MKPQSAILEPVPEQARHLWIAGADASLVFLAFGKSFDACEAQLRRMTGHDDGISDALFGFTRPLTGGDYWCPPKTGDAVDVSALG
jgi:putative iron-dependent peroxidase